MRLFPLLFSLLCLSGTLFADPTARIKEGNEPEPWLIGPLLTPSGHVIPNGHYNIEPYEFYTTNFGLYNKHWIAHDIPNNFTIANTQVVVQMGMPSDWDFTFTPSWSWNHIDGASHWVLNDLDFGFDYQLLYDKKERWWPAIKLQLRANAPLGRYQKLNPKYRRTDAGGAGSWFPGFGIVMSDRYWLGGYRFFVPRFSIEYTLSTPVHVKNFNVYGGGHHTRGKVYPGHNLSALFGFELSFTQRFAIAGDILYSHFNKTRFKGHKGATLGIPNPIGLPSIESLSFAPAIEYDWSANYGIIAGVWFSATGRNAPEFASAVIAVNIYH
jgi:hypothetical protein